MRSLSTAARRAVVVPVVNGRVRCPVRVDRDVTVADCAECYRRERMTVDYMGRRWVRCRV